jgi:glycosyltransferase involved in cell wall biosynthesis
MLPFFFRHYDKFVDRYVLYDDGSKDRTLSILAEHPRTEVRSFRRSHPDSFVLSEQALSNECWKESRGEADWVIVTDVDEHLFHPNMRQYLADSSTAGITLIPALGFQMITLDFPRDEEILCQTHPFGAPWAQMMKCSIFNPSEIREIRFQLGRHRADPIGNLRFPHADEVLLLHYKYLNFARTRARHLQLAKGLGRTDAANSWGHKYLWSLEEFRKDWNQVLAAAIDTRDLVNGSAKYPLGRWWESLRRGAITASGSF